MNVPHLQYKPWDCGRSRLESSATIGSPGGYDLPDEKAELLAEDDMELGDVDCARRPESLRRSARLRAGGRYRERP